MDESAMAEKIIHQVGQVAEIQQIKKVLEVHAQLVASSRASLDELLRQFTRQAQGTVAEGARLEVRRLEDEDDTRAEELVLEDVVSAC